MSIYIAIDMKSFYASVECVARGLNPLTARLLVADESRSDKTICLAVSPALKALGVPSRPRLFEAKQAIHYYEKCHNVKVDYFIACPRMTTYEKISADIYGIYLRYAAPEDIHVYSIDECFIDATPYLHLYHSQAKKAGRHPAHIMAMSIIHDVLRNTGITATVGLGTNLYLAKVAMDIVAKNAPADKDGVRIAYLNEDLYKFRLWNHRPLTDFWQIGNGKARRLETNMLFTMGDIAEKSQIDEEWFYRTFGIDAEILIDHAWGIEPVRMCDIKNYQSDSSSLTNGQVLPRPYTYKEARTVFKEMVEVLCTDMYKKHVVSDQFSWYISYDYKSLEVCPHYDGPLTVDYYGRLHPKHASGTVRLPHETSIPGEVRQAMLLAFDAKTDHRLLFRRLGVNAGNLQPDNGIFQLDLFTDYDALDKERRLQRATSEVRTRYGENAVLKGMNFLEGATTRERNKQIGGHRA
ncbi:MAG: DNA methylase [Lachnospiraceae bacterium]|nr:DNA methylase [Lachnospiraceae bacterium]